MFVNIFLKIFLALFFKPFFCTDGGTPTWGLTELHFITRNERYVSLPLRGRAWPGATKLRAQVYIVRRRRCKSFRLVRYKLVMPKLCFGYVDRGVTDCSDYMSSNQLCRDRRPRRSVTMKFDQIPRRRTVEDAGPYRVGSMTYNRCKR